MIGTVSVQRLLRACLGALGLALLWLLFGATDARADEVRPAPAALVLSAGVSGVTHQPSAPVPSVLSRVVTHVVETPTRSAAPSKGESKASVGQRDSSSTGSRASGAGQAPRSSAPSEQKPAVGRVLRATGKHAATTVRTSAATVDAVVAAASAVVAPVDRAGAVAGVLEGAGAAGDDLLETVSGVLGQVAGQDQQLPLPQPPAPLPGASVHRPSTDGAVDPETARPVPGHRPVPPLLAATPDLPTGPALEGSVAAARTGADRAAAAVRDRRGAGEPGPAPALPVGAPGGVVPASAGGTHGGHSGDNAAEPGNETILDPHAAALGTAAPAAEHPAPPRVPGFRPE
jgi:hypothetical protein